MTETLLTLLAQVHVPNSSLQGGSTRLSFLLTLVLVLLAAWYLVRWMFAGRMLRGLVQRLVFGLLLLVSLSVVALVVTIGQGIRYVSPHPTPGMRVGPDWVEISNGPGRGMKVTPFGVEINGGDGQAMRVTPGGFAMMRDGVVDVQRRQQSRDPMIPEQVFKDAWEVSSARQQWFRSHRSPSEPAPAEVDASAAALPAESPAQEQSVAPAGSPVGQFLLAEHFDPDVYQSEGAAVRGVTNQIVKVLDSVTYARKEPKTINIQGKLDQPQVVEMMDILSKAFPSASVGQMGGPNKPNAETVIVYVSRELRESAAGKTAGADQVLRIDATGSEGKVTRSAPFLDKPWVDNFDGFWSRNPKHNWIMALSRSPATSAEDAEQQAVDDAIRQIEPRVRERMGADVRGGSAHLLQRQIRSGLPDSGLIVDRFVQRFERPYGQIWQVALLIDAVPKKIGSLAEKCDRVLAAQQRTFRQTVLSIAGVIALVCVVYIFLNSMTKGYFVWTLRAAAIAIIAGGVFLVLLLSHNEPMVDGFLR